MMGAGVREVFEKGETGKLKDLKDASSLVSVSIRASVEIYACVALPVASMCSVDSSCFMQACY